jgi:hypothetical protein
MGAQVGNELPPTGGPGKEDRGTGRALSTRITGIMDQLTPRPSPDFRTRDGSATGDAANKVRVEILNDTKRLLRLDSF